MAIELTVERQAGALPVEAYVVGDVQLVIRSRADKLGPAPQGVTHGLGALSTSGPPGAGEGIVMRGWTGITPPVADAGVSFSYSPTLESVTTPFFLGWSGSPLAAGRLTEGTAATVRQIYEAAFANALSHPGLADASVLFLEIVGLFPAVEIYDRALQVPVDTGDVLITSAEHAQRYFKFKIIQQDLLGREYPSEHLVPLAVAGVGFKPGVEAADLRRFEQAAFYEPPHSGKKAREAQPSGVKTHSHAIGWRDQPALRDLLAQVGQRPDWKAAVRALDDAVLPELLESPPDYVVHLDEWSRMVGGVIRVFVPTLPGGMTFIPV